MAVIQEETAGEIARIVARVLTRRPDAGLDLEAIRLIAGHALAPGYRLATADDILLEHLPRTRVFPL